MKDQDLGPFFLILCLAASLKKASHAIVYFIHTGPWYGRRCLKILALSYARKSAAQTARTTCNQAGISFNASIYPIPL